MGKFWRFLTILVFIDLFFIITGQIAPSGAPGSGSIGSIILNAILNVGDLTFTQLFSEVAGDVNNLFDSPTGFAAILLGGAVTLGTVFTRTNAILFTVVGFTFSLLTADFIFIFVYLASFNSVWATVIIAPMALMYVITVLEWVKGTD